MENRKIEKSPTPDADGGWKMIGSAWPMAKVSWRMANSRWQMAKSAGGGEECEGRRHEHQGQWGDLFLGKVGHDLEQPVPGLVRKSLLFGVCALHG